jgi:tetratricopeptide (TPR) repeat protein
MRLECSICPAYSKILKSMKNIFRIMRLERALIALMVVLGVPSLSCAQEQEKSFTDMINKFTLTPKGEPESEALKKAAIAVDFLKRMELPQASKEINEALQLDARNSYLHFLNGFIYHLQARQGDAEKNEMAIEGYRQALHMDPSNWIAKEFLGLAYMDLKNFNLAKEQFSGALLMSSDSTISIYGLMVASYLTGDAATACAMADRYRKYVREPKARFIRSSVAVYASCGSFDQAALMRQELSKLDDDPDDAERLNRRIDQWKWLYRTPAQAEQRDDAQAAPRMMPVGFKVDDQDAPPAETPAQDDQAPASAPPSAAPPPDNANDGTPRMVLVDVVLISTEELITTAKGVNLLNALTLQLGSAGGPAYSSSTTNNAGASSTIITKTLTIPALSYSLNIANASSGISEVLARPTLAAVEGQSSEFFSGTSLNAGVLSTSSVGTSVIPVDKRFGVKLAVTPNFLPNGMVKLKVDAERTFLNANSNNTGFAYRLDVAETTANANVVMQLGDTLVLSGLTDKESSTSRTGVPLLQDVPVLQYLFSSKRTSDYQNSVLILLTPRAPAYTSKMSRTTSGAVTDSMRALREKLGFSGRTPSNIESILAHLKTTNLFTEFRQGDVSLERWDRMHSTGERLKQALEFLYY